MDYVYDPSSNVVEKILTNGVVSWADFDKVERMESLRYEEGGMAVAYFDYGRDEGGRIIRMAREIDVVVYYSYDDVDRLTAEVWRKKSNNDQIYAFTYDYDAAGNRLKMLRESTAGTEVQSAYYGYDGDNSLRKRLVTTPSPSSVSTYYYYDANGALSRMWDSRAADATYFEYAANQLVTKVIPPAAEGQPWEFDYDGQLNRYYINRGGTERYLLWDGLNCLEERNVSDGSLHARYSYGYTPIYGIGSCVEIYKPGSPDKWYTLVMDHRATAYAILDESGAEIGRRQYDAFGVILSQTGTWPTDLAYQTNWQTIQIGNKWWGLSAARMYDFDTGRFTQRDPLYRTSERGGLFATIRMLHTYDFVDSSPLDYVDIRGLHRCCVSKFEAPKTQTITRDLRPGGTLKGSFTISAEFNHYPEGEKECCCYCCQYRQSVKGELKDNQVAVDHRLRRGVKLVKDEYREDGREETRYGWRNEPNREEDNYSSTRESGCKYTAFDNAGFGNLELDHHYSVELTFLGRIVDVCQTGQPDVEKREWEIKISGAVRP